MNEMQRTREAFLDWYGIWPGATGFEPDGRLWVSDAPLGVTLRVQPAERSEPFLRPDRPWDEGYLNHLYIRHEHGQYRMWYTGGAPKNGSFLCYATSDDGFAWTKPALGLHEFAGSRANNILLSGPGGESVFLDPIAPEAERYKMLGGTGWFEADGRRLEGGAGMEMLRAGQEVAIGGATLGLVSPDGLRWTQIPEPLFEMFSDGQNIAYYDEALKKYVGYFRCNMFRQDGLAAWPPNPRRCIGRAETSEFRHWPIPRIVLQPDSQDPPTDDFYGNGFCRYPGGRHQVMFPSVYHRIEDALDAQLAVSRDGFSWTRPERVPMIALDRGEHALYSSPELVPLGSDRWGVAYVAATTRHNEGYYYPTTSRDTLYRWAMWKRDRLVALEATIEGQVTMLPLPFSGEPIALNYQTEANGWIRVELIGPNPLWPPERKEPLPGYSFADCEPLRGDNLDGVVRWRESTDVSSLRGRSLCLRIQLSHAKLFAVTV